MSWLSKNKEKIVGVLSAFCPQVKAVAGLVGIGAATVAVTGNTVEEKITAIAVALVTSAVHKLVYFVKDYLDNGKFDKSVKE